MSELQAIARYVVPESNHREVLDLLRELAVHARNEPGNISFDILENIDDPTRIVLLERYQSANAFADHRETPHFRALVINQIVPLLSERTVEQLDVPEA